MVLYVLYENYVKHLFAKQTNKTICFSRCSLAKSSFVVFLCLINYLISYLKVILNLSEKNKTKLTKDSAYNLGKIRKQVYIHKRSTGQKLLHHEIDEESYREGRAGSCPLHRLTSELLTPALPQVPSILSVSSAQIQTNVNE